MVKEQEVDLLFGAAPDHRDPYLFQIAARVKKPERMAYVESAITAALEDLQKTPVPPERLQTVKSHLRYAFAMGLDTAGAVAQSLAAYIALTGDPEAVNRVYATYDRITPEDIRRAATTFLTPAGRTVVTLSHKDEGAAATPEGAAGAAW